MTTIDLITMIGNLSRSLEPVQNLIRGFSYLLGCVFVIKALMEFKKIGEQGRGGGEHLFSPVIYFLFGAVFIFLPSGLEVAANTVFGVGSVISYADFNSPNIYVSMGVLIRTIGLIWFIRGCVLVSQASKPGAQHGAKGLAFISAGILAINFDSTVANINSMLNYLIKVTLNFKKSQGY